jgi:hypothetical protein
LNEAVDQYHRRQLVTSRPGGSKTTDSSVSFSLFRDVYVP